MTNSGCRSADLRSKQVELQMRETCFNGNCQFARCIDSDVTVDYVLRTPRVQFNKASRDFRHRIREKLKLRKIIVCIILSVCLFWGISRAQEPRKIDFARDVQPILKTRCIGCHGPAQQKNGFRLDRRGDAMRGGTIAVIGPGNSAGSRLYQRLTGSEFGIQMPPTGALSSAEVGIIKDWIEQGAEWPDALSGETPPPPPDAFAGQMMDALREGNRQAFQKLLRDQRGHIDKQGPGGSTPLMYAALYGDLDSARQLLQDGADPNIQNEAGATALMWATDSLEMVSLLVEHGANVNAKSTDSRTPLLIAYGRFGAGPGLKYLLDH